MYALLVGALIGLPYAFGRPEGRIFTHRLLLLILALGAFGVGMDMLHSLLRGGPGHRLTGLVEDGGEMAVISLMAAFVFACAGQTARRSRPAPAGAPLPTG